MDFMFQYFKKLSKAQLSITDLRFSSHTTFRAYVDKLCSAENSGWTRQEIEVHVEGFPELKARRDFPCRLQQRRIHAATTATEIMTLPATHVSLLKTVQ